MNPESPMSPQNVRFITADNLQKLLSDAPSSVQVVDCRSFLNYNNERISGSVNVYCPPLVKRRFQTYMPLDTMLSPETRLTLCRSTVSTVVLHDQSTDEALFQLGQTDLPLILHSLRQLVGDRDYAVLSGGYCRFRHECPRLCSAHTSFSGQLRHISRSSSPKMQTCPDLSIAGTTTCGLTIHGREPLGLWPPAAGHRSYSNRIPLTPVELLPYLYIGDASHSSSRELLQRFAISAILNVSTSCENHFPRDFRYKVIPVEDSSNANLLQWFKDAILFIESERRAGGRVLVHCHGGISRSATVCLAYMMYARHLHLDDAFEYVQSRRHIISPNANFMMQLTQFESELRSLGVSQAVSSLQETSSSSPGSPSVSGPPSRCRLPSYGSCPDIPKLCVNGGRQNGQDQDEMEEDIDDALSKDREEEEEDGEAEEEEEEEEESSSCSDGTPVVFGHSVTNRFFPKTMTASSLANETIT